MSSVPKLLLSPEEYLVRERAAKFRSEFYRGEMFAMAGASYAHSRIKDNLARATNNLLEGGPCFATTSDFRVKVSKTGLYSYPDVVIHCGEPQFEDQVLDTLLNPQVIVEVLSDSTEKYDRGEKFQQYRQLPSLREYILISQDHPLIEQFVRTADDRWLLTTYSELSETLQYESLTAAVPLEKIYHGVEFPAKT